jgi:spermidine synthase
VPPGDDKPRLIEFPSPFALEPGTVRVLAPAEGFSSEQLDRMRVGAYDQPFIVDDGGIRNLFFTIDAIQSSMRLDDPRALISAYTRKMMAFLLFNPAPRHILMIGLGGGSLAKFCHCHLPRTRVSVVEISAEVIALRDEFAIPPDDERLEIIHGDGAAFLEKTDVRPDIILVDAFDQRGVAPSLASFDFYERASRRLLPAGLLVMNLSGEKCRYGAHIEGLSAAFPGVIRLVPGEGEDNVLIFAFGSGDLADLPDLLWQRAAHLERGLGLQFCRYLERLRGGSVLGPRPGRESNECSSDRSQ